MDELECLERFVRLSEQMKDLRLLRNNDLSARLNIRSAYDGSFTIEVSDWDEDDLRSLLVDLRQFLLEREPVFLNRIHNICQRRLTSDDLKHKLQSARETWKNDQRLGGVKVTIDDYALKPERVADLIVNAHYFHTGNDQDRNELASIGFPDNLLTRHVFQSFVVDALRQAFYVAHMVRLGLRDSYFDFAR